MAHAERLPSNKVGDVNVTCAQSRDRTVSRTQSRQRSYHDRALEAHAGNAPLQSTRRSIAPRSGRRVIDCLHVSIALKAALGNAVTAEVQLFRSLEVESATKKMPTNRKKTG